MDKKDWKEELWLRVSPTVLEHGKGFGDITLGGATDQQGKENILKAFEQEIDRARVEEREILSKKITESEQDQYERGVLVGIFGKDNRCVEDVKADIEYLHSMGELSTDDYNECLGKLKNKSNENR